MTASVLLRPSLNARKIADLGRIHDAGDMASLPQCQGDAEAVASGCLQARVHPFDLLFLKPRQQLAPAVGRIDKIFGARLAPSGNFGVEPVLGNVNASGISKCEHALPAG